MSILLHLDNKHLSETRTYQKAKEKPCNVMIDRERERIVRKKSGEILTKIAKF